MPAANNTEGDALGPGSSSHTTRDKQWQVTTSKQPILKADPIDAWHTKLGIPIPEMIFGDNIVAITHLPSGLRLEFNAFDALDRVSKTAEGMLQVACSEEWKRDRVHQDGIRGVVKPFDWSYSTDYRGTTTGGSGPDWTTTTAAADPIRTDLLSRPDPIDFYDDVMLYEDELADNGIAVLSVKIRVMPARLLLLSRFFLRLDGVLVRVRDTRVYIELDRGRIIRQYTAKEDAYDTVREKLVSRRDHAPEAFRDANLMASMLPIIEDVVEFKDVAV